MVYTKIITCICILGSISSVFGSEMRLNILHVANLNNVSNIDTRKILYETPKCTITVLYNEEDVKLKECNGVLEVTCLRNKFKTKMEQFDSFMRATVISAASVLLLSHKLLWPYPTASFVGAVANVAAGHFIAKDRSLPMQLCAIVLGTAVGIALTQYLDRIALH